MNKEALPPYSLTINVCYAIHLFPKSMISRGPIIFLELAYNIQTLGHTITVSVFSLFLSCRFPAVFPLQYTIKAKIRIWIHSVCHFCLSPYSYDWAQAIISSICALGEKSRCNLPIMNYLFYNSNTVSRLPYAEKPSLLFYHFFTCKKLPHLLCKLAFDFYLVFCYTT